MNLNETQAYLQQKQAYLNQKLEAALAIIAELDEEKMIDDREIALLNSKMRARDRLIAKLASRIRELEQMIGLDEAPPPALREAFANF
ncbi:MAG: hypothetical protein ACPG8W_16325 [Candidatus Promineifilaceae bacterium]